MRFIGLTLIMGLCYLQSFGQVMIKGNVADQIGPLAGCHVTLDDGSNGTYTLENGDFELPTNGEFPMELTFTYIGYNPVQLVLSEMPSAKLSK